MDNNQLSLSPLSMLATPLFFSYLLVSIRTTRTLFQYVLSNDEAIRNIYSMDEMNTRIPSNIYIIVFYVLYTGNSYLSKFRKEMESALSNVQRLVSNFLPGRNMISLVKVQFTKVNNNNKRVQINIFDLIVIGQYCCIIAS